MTDPIMKAVERAKSRGPDVPSVKLCVDCAHYRAARGGVLDDRCEAPENVAATDLVRGENAWHWSLCTNARKPVVLSPGCGPDAAWFEPKSNDSEAIRDSIDGDAQGAGTEGAAA